MPLERLAIIGAYPLDRAPVGGVESCNVAIVDLLTKRDPRLRIDVLCPGDKRVLTTHDGQVRAHGMLPSNYRLARLRRFPRERPVIERFIASAPGNCVVHTSGVISHHVARAASSRGLPSVITLHGVLENDIRVENMPAWKRTVGVYQTRAILREACEAVDHVIAISTYGRDYIRGLNGSVPITVIPNPLDPSFEDITVDPPAEGARILFAANLQPRKGVDVLLESLRQLAPRVPDVHLCAAGPPVNPTYVDGLKAQVERLGLRDRVTWLGQVPKSRVIEEMHHAHVLVLPSYEENLPQILQEAGTVGLPFVATDVGGIAELVPEHRRGELLFEPGDVGALTARLSALLTDPVRRAAVAADLRAHVRAGFSNATFTARTVELYERVLADRDL